MPTRVEIQFIGDDGLTRTTGAVVRGLDDVGRAADDTGRKGTGFGSILTGVFQGVGIAAVNMAAQAGGAIVGFLKDSIGVAGDFESGMNNFKVAAGDALDAAGLKVEDFSKLFLDLGKKLPVSTAEVQEAATTLVKGGLDPMILKMGGLESSLKFAAAAGMDLNSAAELSVKQLGTFVPVTASAAEQTKFLADAQDLLVKAAGASTLDVDKLGDAMLQAGGQARAVGLDYKDFVTAMGLISPSFGSAAEAGTSFKNFLVRLQPATNPARDAMKALGLVTADGASKFYDAQGKFIGVSQASELLKNSLKGLTDAERVQALQTIFGNDAMGAATALAAGGSQAYEQFAQKMEQASGVQAAATGRQQGFNVAVDNMKGSFEALQITIGTAILPLLTDLMNNVISPAVNTITDFSAAIMGDDEAFNKLSPTLQSIVTVVDAVREGFAENGLTGALQALFPWLGDSIPTATSGLSDLWNNTLLPAITTVWAFFNEKIMPILSDLADTAIPILNSALQVLAGLWTDVLKPALEVAWAYINQYVVPILSDVVKWMKENLPPAIQAVADFLTKQLFPAFKTVAEFIRDNVVPVIADIAGLLRDTLVWAWTKYLQPALQDLYNWFNNNLKPILSDAVEWISGVTGGFDGFTGAIKDAIGWIRDLIDAWRDWLRQDTKSTSKPSGSGAGGGSGGGYASGTGFAGTGWRWVGENGPELMRDIGGSRILDARTSAQVASAGAGGPSVTYNIDARGATLTEAQMQAALERALRQVGLAARNRGLAGGY